MCEFCGCGALRRGARTAGANDVPVTLAAIPVKIVAPGALRERPTPRVQRGIGQLPPQRAPR
jgi:hypothetical protein